MHEWQEMIEGSDPAWLRKTCQRLEKLVVVKIKTNNCFILHVQG